MYVMGVGFTAQCDLGLVLFPVLLDAQYVSKRFYKKYLLFVVCRWESLKGSKLRHMHLGM